MTYASDVTTDSTLPYKAQYGISASKFCYRYNNNNVWSKWIDIIDNPYTLRGGGFITTPTFTNANDAPNNQTFIINSTITKTDITNLPFLWREVFNNNSFS